jgi:hypothetical protein
MKDNDARPALRILYILSWPEDRDAYEDLARFAKGRARASRLKVLVAKGLAAERYRGGAAVEVSVAASSRSAAPPAGASLLVEALEQCSGHEELAVKRTQRAGKPRLVSASELAQMGVCERRMVLAARLGERRTPEQLVAAARGTRAHRRFLREALREAPHVQTSEPKGGCFIATAVYGQGPETTVLRAFRDRVLRRARAGRWLIAAYYRISPSVAHWLVLRPWAVAAARVAIRPVVRWADWWLGRIGRAV